MARRGSAHSIMLAPAAAAGAAAVTAAAQLGLGYGLGIVAWAAVDRAVADPDSGLAHPMTHAAWSASLTWTAWILATSVVVGAVVGRGVGSRAAGSRAVSNRAAEGGARTGGGGGAPWRPSIALAATIGALAAVPLITVPASRSDVNETFAPHLLAGAYALAGVAIGALVALVAVLVRTAAANVVVSTVWLWVLAVVAMVDGALSGHGLGYASLAVWKFTERGPRWHSYYLPGALLMLGGALLIGGLTALTSAGRSDGRLGVAVSGATGPLLVAAAYALAAPQAASRHGDALYEQVSAYHVGPYLVLAGLLGSVFIAVASGGRGRSRATAPPRPQLARTH